MIAVKIILIIFGILSLFVSIGGYALALEEYRDKNKLYRTKIIFASIPMIFSVIFIYVGITM